MLQAIILPCILLATCIHATNPGLRLHITQNGMNYANTVAVDLISKTVRNAKIPDQSGSGHHVEYTIYGLAIKNFQLGTSSIKLSSGSDLKWATANIVLEIDGNFHYKYRWHFIKISDHGRFTVKFSGMSFSVGINAGVDANGRPTIKSAQCACNSGHVQFKFHGGRAWIYNTFAGKVSKAISNQFQKMMCGIVQNLIDNNAQKSLSTMKVQVKLGKLLTLDYRLMSAPKATPQFMEASLKGEILWSSNKTEAPFAPQSMAPITDSKRMVYITLSEYVFNTMFYQAHKHNMLVFNLASKNIKEKKDILNTTCSGLCIGKFIPQIGKAFPRSTVELHMLSTKPPVTNISVGVLGVRAEGNITLFARKSDKSLHYLFIIYAKASIKVNLSMANEMIHGKLYDMKILTKVTNSAIGTINDRALQFLVDSAIITTIEPMINGLGTKGFPMPSTKDLQFQQSGLKLLQNTILIETDLKYAPKSTVLKFVPMNERYLANEI
ncbi:lipopolysaccharide-binding protein-like [Mytilus californianus]|uniref:lipopolysaccharide-binding protein-like n=1 Tax=Mytilus californianus TaxID=6549 RepID=UPI0022459D94|nr:lipopolysaccharide-binding protein-like [Mytilus californianus]